jgi:DNA gyrase subunit A
VLPLLDIIEHFIEFRREVVGAAPSSSCARPRRAPHPRRLKIALDHLDEVIRLIRGSKSPAKAREG